MNIHASLHAPAVRRAGQPLARVLAGAFVAGTLGLGAAPAFAITVYDITLVGLYDAAHTSSSGEQNNWAQRINSAGAVAGWALRYGTNYVGYSAWLYSNGSTQRIGLTDAAHTRSDGYQSSYVTGLNDAGQVIGYASRFAGPAQIGGQSAWFHSDGVTRQIGLTDAAHTRIDDYQYNSASRLNDAGHIAGTAAYFGGAPSIIPGGSDAWFYDGSTTQVIGLTDAAHTFGSYGIRNNTVKALNSAGQVAGNADRYNGAASAGQSAWLYGDGTTREISLIDASHTRSDGYRASEVLYLNGSGQATGQAERFSSAVSAGQSAWLHDGNASREIGLTGASHTRSDGYQDNTLMALNSAGQAAGYAQRFSGTSDAGFSAWIFDGNATLEIGLTDAAHTRDDGYRANGTFLLNDTGKAAGIAYRYDSTTSIGQSTWYYDGIATREIGLTAAAQTRDDGYQANTATSLNVLGQVTGYAENFDGADPAGQSAWFYDPVTNTTYAMDASAGASASSNSTYINFLGEDGLTLGSYYFSDTGASGAFSFTLADGWHDLGSLVDGGLDDAGWARLANALRANESGQILGRGTLEGVKGDAVYLLTPVPEPETWSLLLAGLGLVGAAVRVRRG